jgi:uncharacterized protein YybS (DUF2232 family)
MKPHDSTPADPAQAPPLLCRVLWALWPSFLVAGVAEMAFFSVVDPEELVWLRHGLELPETAIYSVGFFFFWVTAFAASALSLWLSASPACPTDPA